MEVNIKLGSGTLWQSVHYGHIKVDFRLCMTPLVYHEPLARTYNIYPLAERIFLKCGSVDLC